MHTQHRIFSQRGVTLVELMIGMTLGVLIIGGVIGVFASNAATARAKRELDNAQEAFRFSAYTISRIVRNSNSIADPAYHQVVLDSNDSPIDDENKLVVNFPRDPGRPDCLGDETPGEITMTFSLGDCDANGENCRLICEVNGSPEEIEIARGFRIVRDANDNEVTFTYAAPLASGSDGTLNYGNYAAGDASVRVEMATESDRASGIATSFTATSRAQVLN